MPVPLPDAKHTAQVLAALAPHARCLLGFPFEPTEVDPSWRTEAVVALARGIYADAAFERLPVLADALEDADCTAADVVAHCRGDGPPVRSCFAVDALLGLE